MKNSLATLIRAAQRISSDAALPVFFSRASALLVSVLAKGGKILIAGNGGSAAEAQHFAAELVGRYLRERRALPAIALSTDTSILTALGNDYSFACVFARQIEALGKKGDALILLSTSGESKNLLAAARAARKRGLYTIALLGKGGGALKGRCELDYTVPSGETPRVQELHLLMLHALAEALEGAVRGR